MGQNLLHLATNRCRVISVFARYTATMKDAPHILVVDDHREIRDSVTRYLERNGMRATGAKDAADMDLRIARGSFDLIILDVMMPGEDGLSACKRLSKTSDIPVLMLTALGDDDDRIRGLDIGADDYLGKPFNPRELLARINAILRRSKRQDLHGGNLAGRKVRFAHLELDHDRHTLTSDAGEVTPLTSGELKMLSILLERARIILSRDELLELTTGRTAGPFDRTIDNQISRLRRKIEPDILRPRIITTVRNGGYCLSCDVEVHA